MEDPIPQLRAQMDQAEAFMAELSPFLTRLTGAHTAALLKAGVPRKAVDICVGQFHETIVRMVFSGVRRDD